MASPLRYVRHSIMTDIARLIDRPSWLNSVSAFAGHVRARLGPGSSGPAGLASDYDLNGGLPLSGPAPKPAAVLIPVIPRSELTVLLTQRTAHLPRHAGQIAFPGGRIDPEDASAEAAALREAEEEIGLDRRFVSLLGRLDIYRSGTGYAISPLVGLVEPGHALTLDPGEVAAAFEVPLSFLMTPQNLKIHSRMWQGVERRFYAIPYEAHYIWGVTAGIIRNMQLKLG